MSDPVLSDPLPQSRIHPVTGALLTRDTRMQVVQVGRRRCTVAVPGWYPEDDGDAIHAGADLLVWDAVVVGLRMLDAHDPS